MKGQIKAIDDSRDVVIPGTHAQTVAWSVQHLLEHAQKTIQEKDTFSIALSGGSTPKAIYNKIPDHPLAKEIDWRKVMVFWSDERVVAPDHPDSNYNMAMSSGWDRLGIPHDHIFRMKTEGDIQWNAHEYEDTIRTQLPGGALDFVMLGMGLDGHTASLFPETHGLNADERLVVANFVPQMKTWRITFTFPCINTAKFTALYILGHEKAETVTAALTGPYQPSHYPCQRVGTPKHKALWVLDTDASRLLQEELQ